MPTAQYIPGTCNIGPKEIRLRRIAGWIGLISTLLLGALFIYLHVLPWVRIVLFIPATISALGFLQAAFHFCAAFGMKGLFNVSSEVGKTESVSQQEFLNADKRKALVIISYAVWIGLVVAFGAVYV